MISFASLFLGLVFGVVNVELIVAQPASRVELFLDETRVCELRAPWKAPLDLGRPPAPHELVAVAFDGDGREVGRARQWINRPRAVAEASFVLEPGQGGDGRIAHLTWRCLTSETPSSITVTFDGKPLTVGNPGRIAIPSHVPAQVHFLRAVLKFEGNVTGVADAILGGPRNVGSLSELTALPVILEKGQSLPPVDQLGEWFVTDDAPLTVIAIDKAPEDIVFVCEASARKELARIGVTYRNRAAGGRASPVSAPMDRSAAVLGRNVGIRLLFPIGHATSQSTMISNLYPITQRFTLDEGGILRGALRDLRWPDVPPDGQRIADAVAVAALSASEGERRRAVVLIVGSRADEDRSVLSPAEAESFLQRARIPLVVWFVGDTRVPPTCRWKNAVGIGMWQNLDMALETLADNLDRQRIVWIEGTHLPQAITLGPAARGIQLAR